MAAGVHGRLFHVVDVDLPRFRGVRKSGFLLHGQPVHVRAQQNSRAFAVFHDRDNPGLTDAMGYVKAEGREFVAEALRCFDFAEREFRIGVEVLEQRFEVRLIVRLDGGFEAFGRRGAGGWRLPGEGGAGEERGECCDSERGNG